MVQAPDASAIMGGIVGTEAVDELARGSYSQNVNERMPRDYVTMYHPDGTMSTVQLPPMGKNGKGMKDRQQKIMHYMMNKRRSVRQPDGTFQVVQWWFPTKPEGWTPQPLPWRCPAVDCPRAGGFPNELQLYRHIMYKHGGDKELYAGVTKALVERLGGAAAINLDTLRTDLPEAAVFCDVCTAPCPEGHADPEAWLRGHKLGAHKEAE